MKSYCATESKGSLLGKTVEESSGSALCTESPELPFDHGGLVKPECANAPQHQFLSVRIEELDKPARTGAAPALSGPLSRGVAETELNDIAQRYWRRLTDESDYAALQAFSREPREVRRRMIEIGLSSEGSARQIERIARPLVRAAVAEDLSFRAVLGDEVIRPRAAEAQAPAIRATLQTIIKTLHLDVALAPPPTQRVANLTAESRSNDRDEFLAELSRWPEVRAAIAELPDDAKNTKAANVAARIRAAAGRERTLLEKALLDAILYKWGAPKGICRAIAPLFGGRRALSAMFVARLEPIGTRFERLPNLTYGHCLTEVDARALFDVLFESIRMNRYGSMYQRMAASRIGSLLDSMSRKDRIRSIDQILEYLHVAPSGDVPERLLWAVAGQGELVLEAAHFANLPSSAAQCAAIGVYRGSSELLARTRTEQRPALARRLRECAFDAVGSLTYESVVQTFARIHVDLPREQLEASCRWTVDPLRGPISFVQPASRDAIVAVINATSGACASDAQRILITRLVAGPATSTIELAVDLLPRIVQNGPISKTLIDEIEAVLQNRNELPMPLRKFLERYPAESFGEHTQRLLAARGPIDVDREVVKLTEYELQQWTAILRNAIGMTSSELISQRPIAVRSVLRQLGSARVRSLVFGPFDATSPYSSIEHFFGLGTLVELLPPEMMNLRTELANSAWDRAEQTTNTQSRAALLFLVVDAALEPKRELACRAADEIALIAIAETDADRSARLLVYLGDELSCLTPSRRGVVAHHITTLIPGANAQSLAVIARAAVALDDHTADRIVDRAIALLDVAPRDSQWAVRQAIEALPQMSPATIGRLLRHPLIDEEMEKKLLDAAQSATGLTYRDAFAFLETLDAR